MRDKIIHIHDKDSEADTCRKEVLPNFPIAIIEAKKKYKSAAIETYRSNLTNPYGKNSLVQSRKTRY